MILADLHIHSTFSDGKMTIPEIVDFYGSRGFGCIAVTDHVCEDKTFLGLAASYLSLTLTRATFPIYMEIIKTEAERAWDRYKMILLPGFELSKNSWFNHRSAHILGLGVSDFVSADGEIVELTQAIRAQGALTVAAHPVSTGAFEPQTYHLWSRREELRGEFDAWEVASGPKIFDAVKNSGLPMLASSDLHHPNQINAWKTVLECEKHPEAILEAIRRQEVRFEFYQEVVTEPVPYCPIGLGQSRALDSGHFAHALGNLARVSSFESSSSASMGS